MESLNDAIRTGMEQDTAAPSRSQPIPCARDVMASRLVVFHPEQPIRDVIRMLLRHRISGGPVVDEQQRLLGTITEGDCLKVLASGMYDGAPVDTGRLVRDLMTPVARTVDPSADIYTIAQILVDATLRRVPVVEGDRVVGQVSRRDVLKAIETMC